MKLFPITLIYVSLNKRSFVHCFLGTEQRTDSSVLGSLLVCFFKEENIRPTWLVPAISHPKDFEGSYQKFSGSGGAWLVPSREVHCLMALL